MKMFTSAKLVIFFAFCAESRLQPSSKPDVLAQRGAASFVQFKFDELTLGKPTLDELKDRVTPSICSSDKIKTLVKKFDGQQTPYWDPDFDFPNCNDCETFVDKLVGKYVTKQLSDFFPDIGEDLRHQLNLELSSKKTEDKEAVLLAYFIEYYEAAVKINGPIISNAGQSENFSKDDLSAWLKHIVRPNDGLMKSLWLKKLPEHSAARQDRTEPSIGDISDGSSLKSDEKPNVVGQNPLYDDDLTLEVALSHMADGLGFFHLAKRLDNTWVYCYTLYAYNDNDREAEKVKDICLRINGWKKALDNYVMSECPKSSGCKAAKYLRGTFPKHFWNTGAFFKPRDQSQANIRKRALNKWLKKVNHQTIKRSRELGILV